jgi:hypothetical protein
MDPFSASASVIAVLQISGTIISALYSYRTGVHSASKDAARIIYELNSLRSVLESLLSVLESETASSSPPSYAGKNALPSQAETSTRLATINTLAQPDGDLHRCQQELEKLAQKLSKGDESRVGGVVRALTWPLKKEQVEASLLSLQRAKATLSLALQTDQVAIAMATQNKVGSLAEMFEEGVLDARKGAIKLWLSAPDPFVNHGIARKKRQAMTGDVSTIFEHSMSRSWPLTCHSGF